MVPTPLGTALGLQTDTDAQVLTDTGDPIPGLYAVGNDAQSITGSEYPGAGCQVGASLTFGYIAARHPPRPPVLTFGSCGSSPTGITLALRAEPAKTSSTASSGTHPSPRGR